MTDLHVLSVIGAILFFLLHVAVIIRAILRPHRSPASRIAWVVVIIVVPGLGMLAYLFLGETSIGRTRVARMRTNLEEMPDLGEIEASPLWPALNLHCRATKLRAFLSRERLVNLE